MCRNRTTADRLRTGQEATDEISTHGPKDKVIEVEGIVPSDRDANSSAAFLIAGVKTPSDILALDVSCFCKTKAKKGHRVRAVGKYFSNNGMEILLESCTFTDLGKTDEDPDKFTPSGPAIVVSAEHLARDFKADNAAAEKKYKDQLLEVEGVSASVGGGVAGMPHTLILKGAEYTDVECEFWK